MREQMNNQVKEIIRKLEALQKDIQDDEIIIIQDLRARWYVGQDVGVAVLG